MARVRGFILSQFGKHFLLIFLPFFFILSIVYIIRISSLSQKIPLTINEFSELFGYFIPEILFYTVPISFIVGLVSTVKALSSENELTTLFSFGLSPLSIIKHFLIVSVLFSVLLLSISIFNIQENISKFNIFKAKKITTANLLIKEDTLGQKFGNFFVFAENVEGDNIKNLVLFSNTKNNKVIFFAKEGSIKNMGTHFTLTLKSGRGSTFVPDRVRTLSYDQMIIYSAYKNNSIKGRREWSFGNISNSSYQRGWFLYYVFLSMLPIFIFLPLIASSTQSSRSDKSLAHPVAFASILGTYSASAYLKESGSITLFILLLLTLLCISIFSYMYIRRQF